MAPTDLSTSASSASYSGLNGSIFPSSTNYIKVASNGSPSMPIIPIASSSALPATVLSPQSPKSTIKEGHSACYDDVKQLLCTQPPWTGQHQKVLMEPYEHLASRPGKEIRSQMIDAFNVWLKVPEEKIKIVHKVIGMLHTSSLLVDDVEDDSILRRGAPVAHSIFGIPQTINTANYVYFLVFGEILKMNKEEDAQRQMQIQQMIVDEMINLHRGQGMDLYWRDNHVCPNESEYIEMVNNKTSGLLRIVIKLMFAISPLSEEQQELRGMLVTLVNLIGLLFQIRDDYMNLRSGDYAQNKGYCEDLTEGKFSFPLIHSIRQSNDSSSTEANGGLSNGHSSSARAIYPSTTISLDTPIASRQQLVSILQSRPKDAATKRKVVDYMDEQTASFAYCRDVMARLDRLIDSEVVSIEGILGEGQANVRLRGILAALRKGWC